MKTNNFKSIFESDFQNLLNCFPSNRESFESSIMVLVVLQKQFVMILKMSYLSCYKKIKDILFCA